MSSGRRFVILTHDHPVLHWDLMLEAGDALWTWRLADEPQPGLEIDADRLPDHRLMYLNYEGPVSGDRGTVSRWDAGTYARCVESAVEVRAALCGARLQGTVALRRRSDAERWTFLFEPAGAEER